MPKNNLSIAPNSIDERDLKPHLRAKLRGSVNTANIILSGGAGNVYEKVPEKTFFVSPKFTENSAPYFASIQTALDNATTGYLLIVYPGEYNEVITLVDGVNLYFHEGASLTGTPTGTDGIITAQDVECIIDGKLVIDNDSARHIWIDGCTIDITLLDCLSTSVTSDVFINDSSAVSFKARIIEGTIETSSNGSFDVFSIKKFKNNLGENYLKAFEVDLVDMVNGRLTADFTISQVSQRNWSCGGGELIIQNGYFDDNSQQWSLVLSGGVTMLSQVRMRNIDATGGCVWLAGDGQRLINQDVLFDVDPAGFCIDGTGTGNQVYTYQAHSNYNVGTGITQTYGSVTVSSNILVI